MTTMTESTLENLQDLIRVNIDSYKGFEQAADTVDNPSLANLFRTIASYRKRHADELARVVGPSSKEVPDSGNTSGTLHRWWIAARGALNGGDEKVVLIEAERGEDAIKEQYEQALQETVGTAIHDVLRTQYAEVKNGHDQIRDMRDAAKKK